MCYQNNSINIEHIVHKLRINAFIKLCVCGRFVGVCVAMVMTSALYWQVWSQVRTLMEKNASLEAAKRNLEDELDRVTLILLLVIDAFSRFRFVYTGMFFFINHFTDLLPEEFQHQVCGDDALPGLGQSRSSAENRAVQGRNSGEKSKRIKHSIVKSPHRQILCYLCFHFVEQALAFFLYFIRFD